MKLYDDAVLEAAASRESGDSAGAWRLADALLAEIPTGTPGRKGGDVAPVSDGLQQYAARLAAESIHTPAGGPYSASTLDDLRDVAMAWPAATRYPQAAFRTHQEAGRPGSALDVALKALCRYASGGAKRRPQDIDADAWARAIEQVDKLTARRAKYTVSANALRLAAQRKINTPPRNTQLQNTAPQSVEATAAVIKSLPPEDRAALVEELVTTDSTARRSADTASRKVRSDELAAAHKHFEETHANKRTTRTGGPDDAQPRTIVDQPLAALGVLIETEPIKESLPRLIKVISDKRDLLSGDDFEYLREWAIEVRRDLDIIDELLKLGQGLTDEALADLLRGQ